jgi:hypothetical protein
MQKNVIFIEMEMDDKDYYKILEQSLDFWYSEDDDDIFKT